ncbi:MAG: DoxX family protein [Phycisphaeraceae bacterium]|nr:MAG: DoxX family protein [Phycisphaeraceae bacterium]
MIDDEAPDGGVGAFAHGAFLMLAQDGDGDEATEKIYTSADFTGPVVVRQVYSVALTLHRAGHPEADGAQPLIPDWMLDDSRPAQLAWAAGLTELICGVLVLIGLLTRLSALALAGTMAMALWVTSIGPIVFGPADTASFLGVLPPLENFSPQAWNMWLWQFALLLSALALVFSRPGLLALDGLLFGARRPHSKPAPAK